MYFRILSGFNKFLSPHIAEVVYLDKIEQVLSVLENPHTLQSLQLIRALQEKNIESICAITGILLTQSALVQKAVDAYGKAFEPREWKQYALQGECLNLFIMYQGTGTTGAKLDKVEWQNGKFDKALAGEYLLMRKLIKWFLTHQHLYAQLEQLRSKGQPATQYSKGFDAALAQLQSVVIDPKQRNIVWFMLLTFTFIDYLLKDSQAMLLPNKKYYNMYKYLDIKYFFDKAYHQVYGEYIVR